MLPDGVVAGEGELNDMLDMVDDCEKWLLVCPMVNAGEAGDICWWW